jgi:hypothetical protein
MAINAEPTRFMAGFAAPFQMRVRLRFIAKASPIVAKCGSDLASTPFAFD